MMQLRLPAAAALLAALAFAAPARADAVSEGTQLIRSMGDTVIAILANKGLPKAQREDRFRQIWSTWKPRRPDPSRRKIAKCWKRNSP